MHARSVTSEKLHSNDVTRQSLRTLRIRVDSRWHWAEPCNLTKITEQATQCKYDMCISSSFIFRHNVRKTKAIQNRHISSYHGNGLTAAYPRWLKTSSVLCSGKFVLVDTCVVECRTKVNSFISAKNVDFTIFRPELIKMFVHCAWLKTSLVLANPVIIWFYVSQTYKSEL